MRGSENSIFPENTSLNPSVTKLPRIQFSFCITEQLHSSFCFSVWKYFYDYVGHFLERCGAARIVRCRSVLFSSAPALCITLISFELPEALLYTPLNLCCKFLPVVYNLLLRFSSLVSITVFLKSYSTGKPYFFLCFSSRCPLPPQKTYCYQEKQLNELPLLFHHREQRIMNPE